MTILEILSDDLFSDITETEGPISDITETEEPISETDEITVTSENILITSYSENIQDNSMISDKFDTVITLLVVIISVLGLLLGSSFFGHFRQR